ncbi:MAG: activator of (R)-2-hydroxyglutaryl-CoA dehydratase [Thermodesulfobacteriota bacterium]
MEQTERASRNHNIDTMNEEPTNLHEEGEQEPSHFTRPQEAFFTKEQRDHTTILFGGLPWKHELLSKGTLESLGYRAENLPVPTVESFQMGKEYGNNGQCNPTYFTVGNLVQHLKKLEQEGLTKKEIIDNYIFFTAGSCGPCRFGMYEAEYRLALDNAGFSGFRVILFQQAAGMEQSGDEAGLELNMDFFLGFINSLMMADLINGLAYQIRPYEVNKGETDKVLDEAMQILYKTIKEKRPFEFSEKARQRLNTVGMDGAGNYVGKFISQLYGDDYTAGLRHVAERLNTIEIDPFRVKPVVKITGEFWAQTTEGDGNFNMFAFLEKEGAEADISPISNWISYLLHKAKQSAHDRRGLCKDGATAPEKWEIKKRLGHFKRFKKKELMLGLTEKIFSREYRRYIKALGGTAHDLIDQAELERLAHRFYHSRSDGGEGHLEVAKNIYYTEKELAHMVLSLKPFGCLPSTQSDGVQAAVVSHYKKMIFLPIETSGEGEINAHSRVQMALGEAKTKARKEFKEVLEKSGFTLEELKAYVESHPDMKRPLYHLPHYKGVTGRAARFVKHVAEVKRVEIRKSHMKRKRADNLKGRRAKSEMMAS